MLRDVPPRGDCRAGGTRAAGGPRAAPPARFLRSSACLLPSRRSLHVDLERRPRRPHLGGRLGRARPDALGVRSPNLRAGPHVALRRRMRRSRRGTRPRRRHLLAQGVRPSDVRVPGPMRLLHVRERSRGGAQDLHVARAGHRRGGARARRGRDGVPVHPRRQTGGFVPSREAGVERHGIRVHRGLPGALRERRAGANGPVTALQRGGADEGGAGKVEGGERLARADARVDVRSVGGRAGRGAF